MLPRAMNVGWLFRLQPGEPTVFLSPKIPEHVDLRYLLFVLVCFSIVSQAALTIARFCFRARQEQEQEQQDSSEETHPPRNVKVHIHSLGGCLAFGYLAARLFGCLVLLQLSLRTLQDCQVHPSPHSGLEEICPEYFLTLTYIYTTILALVALSSKSWSSTASRHNVFILLAVFAVYTYRNLWPLATYSQQPLDLEEGRVLWLKIATLGVTSIVIPLFIPRRYIPVDPKDPMPVPNPELTASLISRATYSYIDPVIYLGSVLPHIPHEKLPPLGDGDWARIQKERAFPHVDRHYGAPRRYLLWGLLIHLRLQYFLMAAYVVLYCAMEFVVPIGINRVLNYLETGGSDSDIKPWFWILWLLIGPTIWSVAVHAYLFYHTVARVRLEATVTQLVFEHSLRIRLKAEADTSTPVEASIPPSPTAEHPKNISVANSSASASEVEAFEAQHEHRNETESTLTDASTVVGDPSHLSESSQSTLKGKAKSKPQDTAAPSSSKIDAPVVKKATSENLLGKINNFATSDLMNILDGIDFLNFFISVPLQVILSIIFLYQLLGWSSIVGLVVTILLSPAAGFLATWVQSAQTIKMQKTDTRVQAITEAVGVLRMVKLFGWEKKMANRLEDTREEELHWLWKTKVLRVLADGISLFLPTLTMLATYITYTVIMKEKLTASKIFASMTVFDILRDQLHRISWQTMNIIQAKVSIDRIDNFLQNAELLDDFADVEGSPRIKHPNPPFVDEQEIGFQNASFSWSVEKEDGTLTPSSRSYRLQIEGPLLFQRGRINLIIGPTGSGKTSMLMALLGEMHFIPSSVDSWFNLPRGEGIAYASQESWVQNATIKDNILFGSLYDEDRYKKVIRQCALSRDLELFSAGDQTEVGERGLTLSGGQKARVTLARAIYSPARILLLDDILAALDVHTSTWIVNECLQGDLVKGRTVLLVTHNVALLGPIADFVVSLGVDGRVQSQGTRISAAIQKDSELAQEAAKELEILKKGDQEIFKPDAPTESAKPEGKLIMAEEIAHGHVSWKSMQLIISGLGGAHPTSFLLFWLVSVTIMSAGYTIQPWFLGVWGSQYEQHPPEEVNLAWYISIFVAIILGHVVIQSGVNMWFNWRTIAASRAIHKMLIESVFGSTLRWLDETPTARIIARCTADIRSVDGQLVQDLWWLSDTLISMVMKLGVIVLFTPAFLVPGVLVAFVGLFIGNVYLKAQLSVKREMSNARSPVLAHFSAAINGLVSIRAYGVQESFKKESLKRIDYYSTTARVSWNINRWVGFRIDILGALFTSSLAAYLVYGRRVGAANTGFSLSLGASFCGLIFWLIRIYNDLEVEANSLERIQSYIDIEHEEKGSSDGVPPAAWPTSGDLRVENLSARYSATGPEVLHGLTFHIRSGERVGIVGRTGSGKSSLTLSLLRCILTEGAVYYDSVLTKDINLDALRSNITIIPQTPELISGTLRQNLDPFEQNDDAVLNDALRSAGLFSLQEEAGEARITLDTNIAGGGNNLSVGQRQIIALARAMVRGSKILILDEATSAIDYKTDSVIQKTLRSQLGSDVTVITIAHRLQTIMDADKIMVLDSGHISEFDSPRVLLQNDKGLLKALVEGSGDKEVLYKLAGL